MSCLGIAVGADWLMAEQGAQRLLDIVEASTPVEQRAMHSSLLNFANMNGGDLGTRACRATLFRDKKLVNKVHQHTRVATRESCRCSETSRQPNRRAVQMHQTDRLRTGRHCLCTFLCR